MHSLKDNRCAAIQHLYLMTGLSTLFAKGSPPFKLMRTLDKLRGETRYSYQAN